MVSPDMRTLIFSFLITDLIITIVSVILWIQNRKHFNGTIFWVYNFTFQSLALTLIALRGTVPDWISMVLSNSLVIAGNIMGLIGLEYFAGIRRKHIPNWILLAIFVFIHFWFSIVKSDLPVRNLNLSIAFLIVALQFCWLVGVRLKGEMRRLTLSIGIIFMFYSIVNIGRIVNFFTAKHPGNDYFEANVFEFLVIILYQALFLLLTYALVMMFNKRLRLNISRQEEKYIKSFNSSPYAILMSRMNDGTIMDINYGFSNITGYSETDAIGKTTNELGLWVNEADRMIVVNKLIKRERVYEMEFRFRIKSGEIITGLITSEIMTVNDELTIFSSINDISARKRAEEIVRQQYYTLKGLNDSSKSPIFSVDTNYCYTSFNKTHASVMKHIYNADIEVGMSLLECMTNKDDRQKAKQNIDRALRGEFHSEEAFSGEQGLSRIYFEVTHNPIYNDKSEVIGVAVLAKDMTHRIIIEEELRETSDYLENLIRYANAPIIVWDINLKITRFNHAFENLTGLRVDDVVNKKIDILFPSGSKEQSMENIRNTTLGKRWEVVEIPVQNIDGSIRTVIWNSATIYDKDKITPVAAIAQGQDVTERIEAEKQLKNKIVELETFNKIMVGREIRMIELKKEINELCRKLKIAPKYKAPEEVIQ